MPTGETGEREWTRANVLSGLLFVLGAGLAGVGGYVHLTIAAQVRAGQCDGCEPWHPLIVLAPLVVGSTFLLIASYLLYRR